MMKLIAVPLLALAACGSGQPANEFAGGDPTEWRQNAAPGAEPARTAATDSNTPPRLAEVKTFRDWAVACDNGKTCEATSLAAGDSGLQDIGMIVRRPPGVGGVSISLRATGEQTGAVELLADGERVAGSTLDGDGVALFDSNASARLAAVLPTARNLTVRGAGPETTTISLAGASAALRYMDAEQGRADTATALVAKGDRPFTATPPALPVVIAAPLARGEAAKPTPALIAEMRNTANCPADDFGTPTQDAFKLSDRDTLVLISCGMGAYNAIAAPFVVTGGRAREAAFDEGFTWGEPGTDTRIVNGDWDARTGRLSSYAKGRGLGDCGTSSAWVWDGTRFRLVESESEVNCRGAVKWLCTWTARVEGEG